METTLTAARARLLAAPENSAALAAIQTILHALTSDSNGSLPNPLFLHGPSGAGKTFLLQALSIELLRAGLAVCNLSANDFADRTDFTDARNADLLIVEDLQHLPTRFVATLIDLIDDRARHDLPMIVTALSGPGRLQHRGSALSRRLTSRLAGGLVVALEPMQRATRRRLLEVLADDAQLHPASEILDWLSEHLIGGGRQLEGAVHQWKSLQRLRAKPLTLVEIRAHFRPQVEAMAPSIERITAQVSASFRVAAKQVMSARRARHVLVPRQVSMFLARRLTNLSLAEIGCYFGGRDHKTVQHACAKVAVAMKSDAVLAGAVHQLCTELT